MKRLPTITATAMVLAAALTAVGLPVVGTAQPGPPILDILVEPSGNRNPRAFQPSETMLFDLVTTDSLGDIARVKLIPISGGAEATLNLAYIGGNRYRGTSTANGLGLADGFYDAEFTLCDGATFEEECVDTPDCTCMELDSNPSKIWIDSVPASLVSATQTAIPVGGTIVEPARTMTVVNDADSLEIRVTSAMYSPADSCRFFVTDPLFTTGINHVGGNEYRVAVVFPTIVLPDGYHTSKIDLEDGLASERALRPFKFDTHTPATPIVTLTTDAPAGTPVTVGDMITVAARCEDAAEDTLLTRFGIDVDALVLVAQADAVSDEHTAFETKTYAYTVPASLADGGGVTGTLAAFSTVSDGANRSLLGTASETFAFDTTTPVVSDVQLDVNGEALDCFGVGSVFDFDVDGTANAREASVDIVRPDGLAWISDLPLTWDGFRYAGSYTITQSDVDDAPFTIDGETFTARARIGRSTQLWSDPVDSRGVMFSTGVPSTPLVDSVNDLPAWAFTPGEVAVDDATDVRLSGTTSPDTDVFAEEVGGGASTLVTRSAGDGTWAGSVNVVALGIDLDDATPDQLNVFAELCGTRSTPNVFDLRRDVAPPASPVIEPPMPNAGTLDIVRASATDDAPLTGLLEVCRGVPDGGIVCTNIPMDAMSGPGFTDLMAAVPPELLGVVGVRYRVSVSDGAHVSTREVSPIVAGAGADTGQPGSAFENVGLAADTWHLLSIPTMLTDADAATLFPALGAPADDRWAVFSWESVSPDSGVYHSNYADTLAIDLGEAFWFKWFRSGGVSTRFTFSGDASALEPVELTLVPGWNQVGSPFAFDVAWPAGAPVLRRYSNESYSAGAITRMEPFVGYFVFTPTETTVEIDPDAAISPVPPPRHPEAFALTSPEGWALQVVATGDGWEDADNYAAVHPAADAGLDGWDLREFPRPEAEAVLAFPAPGGRLLSADVRGVEPGVRRWDLILVVPFTPSAADIDISWPNVSALPEGVAVRVTDGRTGAIVDPRIDASMAVEAIAGEHYPLTLWAGPAAELEPAVSASMATPPALTLHPALPNPVRVWGAGPSNAGVRLRYDVPVAGVVTVRIYDVGGRVVAREPARFREPGRYSVVWDARVDGGVAPAGVYFVEVEASGERRSQKVVVLPR